MFTHCSKPSNQDDLLAEKENKECENLAKMMMASNLIFFYLALWKRVLFSNLICFCWLILCKSVIRKFLPFVYYKCANTFFSLFTFPLCTLKLCIYSNYSCFTDDSEDCCGTAVILSDDPIPASSFMRQAAGPTFYVKQGLRRDVAPPSRVIDFHVSSIVNDSLYVELQWSAPGNDYDQGRGNNGNFVTVFITFCSGIYPKNL